MKSTKDVSSAQEKKIAKELNGKTTVASGAVNVVGFKGDVNTENEKIECKITAKDFYTLKFKDLSKLREQAIKDGKIPIFIFEFGSGNRYVIELIEMYDGNSFFNPGHIKQALLTEKELLRAEINHADTGILKIMSFNDSFGPVDKRRYFSIKAYEAWKAQRN